MSSDANRGAAMPCYRTSEPDTDVPVPVKACCAVLVGEHCDCQQFAADARGVFGQPIMCRPARQWGGA
jgi:hypothetical protein